MGFFDFFKNLFGGSKPKIASEELDINVTETVICINGNNVDIPCHLDALIKYFGKPKRSPSKSGNVIFTWDALGLYCYTKGNNVVHCFAVKVNNGDMSTPFEPKTLFKGKLSICGENWEEVMYKGEDMEGFFRQRVFEGLYLVAEYVDFETADQNGCAGAYSGVEISIPMSEKALRELVEK